MTKRTLNNKLNDQTHATCSLFNVHAIQKKLEQPLQLVYTLHSKADLCKTNYKIHLECKKPHNEF